MNRKIICPSCKAEFSDTESKCPYCGTFYYPGAEQEYLNHLADVREDLEDLEEIPEQETKAELIKSGRFIRKVIIVVGVMVLLLIAWILYTDHQYDRDTKADYIWQQTNYPQMQNWYDSENFEELIAFFTSSVEAELPVWSFEHAEFCRLYNDYLEIQEILELEQAGQTPSQYVYISLLYNELILINSSYNKDLTQQDMEYLQTATKLAKQDFETRWSMTEKEKNMFASYAQQHLGNCPYDAVEEYVKTWMDAKERKQS